MTNIIREGYKTPPVSIHHWEGSETTEKHTAYLLAMCFSEVPVTHSPWSVYDLLLLLPNLVYSITPRKRIPAFFSIIIFIFLISILCPIIYSQIISFHIKYHCNPYSGIDNLDISFYHKTKILLCQIIVCGSHATSIYLEQT